MLQLKNFVNSDDDDGNISRGYAILMRTAGDHAVHPKDNIQKLYVLLSFLLAISVGCCIILHCGRREGSLVQNKLLETIQETQESYKQLVYLIEFYKIKIFHPEHAETKQEKKQNPLNDELRANVKPQRHVETDDFKPIFLTTSEACRVTHQTELEQWFTCRNLLTYLKQSTVHWCIITFLVVTITDLYNLNAEVVFHHKQWLLSPLPVWALVIFIPNLIITSLVQLYLFFSIKSERLAYLSFHSCILSEQLYQLLAVFCVTSLPLYVIFHGLWISIVLISFPFRFIPCLVFISFLLSGWKWLSKNFKRILKEVKKNKSVGNTMKQSVEISVKEMSSVKQEVNGSSLQLDHHSSSDINSVKKFPTKCSLPVAGLLILQTSVLLIWILALWSVYSFSDTILAVSDIGEHPLTAIIAAVAISLLFSKFMVKLSPKNFVEIQSVSYHFKRCKITKVIYICTRCTSCKAKSPPPKEDGEEDSSRVGACSKCGLMQVFELATRVIVRSRTADKVSIFLTEEFISQILKDEESAIVSSSYTSADIMKLKSELLAAQSFNMNLNEDEILSIEPSPEPIYEVLDP